MGGDTATRVATSKFFNSTVSEPISLSGRSSQGMLAVVHEDLAGTGLTMQIEMAGLWFDLKDNAGQAIPLPATKGAYALPASVIGPVSRLRFVSTIAEDNKSVTVLSSA